MDVSAVSSGSTSVNRSQRRPLSLSRPISRAAGRYHTAPVLVSMCWKGPPRTAIVPNMQTEEDLPIRKKEAEGIPRNLERLSVDVLKQYIKELDEEKKRAKAEIEARGGALAAAESVFQKS